MLMYESAQDPGANPGNWSLSQRNRRAAPGVEKAVGEAVTAAAIGAAEGDERLSKALDLLKANKVAEAAELFRSVAAEKEARIKRDSRDAACRLSQPRRHRRPSRSQGSPGCLRQGRPSLIPAMWRACFGPDIWRWIEQLGSAEKRDKRVLSLTAGQDWYQYWAQVRLADIQMQRGDLPGALKSYRDGLRHR